MTRPATGFAVGQADHAIGLKRVQRVRSDAVPGFEMKNEQYAHNETLGTQKEYSRLTAASRKETLCRETGDGDGWGTWSDVTDGALGDFALPMSVSIDGWFGFQWLSVTFFLI